MILVELANLATRGYFPSVGTAGDNVGHGEHEVIKSKDPEELRSSSTQVPPLYSCTKVVQGWRSETARTDHSTDMLAQKLPLGTRKEALSCL